MQNQKRLWIEVALQDVFIKKTMKNKVGSEVILKPLPEISSGCPCHCTWIGPNNRSRQSGSRVSHVPWRKNWKMKTGTLASQSASPDQMGVFVGGGPKWFAAIPCVRVYHLFRRLTHTHTHPPSGGWKIKVRTMRWKWRLKEVKGEMNMKWDESYLTGTRRGGTQKKREGENTNINTPGPERANPEKARGKKSGGRRRRTKTSWRTESLEPTYHSET